MQMLRKFDYLGKFLRNSYGLIENMLSSSEVLTPSILCPVNHSWPGSCGKIFMRVKQARICKDA